MPLSDTASPDHSVSDDAPSFDAGVAKAVARCSNASTGSGLLFCGSLAMACRRRELVIRPTSEPNLSTTFCIFLMLARRTRCSCSKYAILINRRCCSRVSHVYPRASSACIRDVSCAMVPWSLGSAHEARFCSVWQMSSIQLASLPLLVRTLVRKGDEATALMPSDSCSGHSSSARG